MSAAGSKARSAAHVLIVGAGGLGCPAAWQLAESGVGRITIVDFDVVELSNLPRQILFTDADLGAPKAPAAARALEGRGADVRGVHARFDETTAEDLAAGVDVVIDATDGAHAKDWLNQWAVRTSLPLVHAAALRSEGRLLAVPAGGRPCLACLFGRLTEQLDSCADLGVWNGVVGSMGFRAAEIALEFLDDPAAVKPAYEVYDFDAGRIMTLGAAANAECPVCVTQAAVEPYPTEVGCAAPTETEGPVAESLDLREERCPHEPAACTQGARRTVRRGGARDRAGGRRRRDRARRRARAGP